MRITFLVLLGLFLGTSCKDKVICSAFQSTYILDDSLRMAFYSPYWRLDEATRAEFLASKIPEIDTLDSMAVGGVPDIEKHYTYVSQYISPINEVRRSKFGVIKYEPQWMKNYKLKDVPMEDVQMPVPLPPREEDEIEIGDFVASDFTTDSTAVDSLLLNSDDSLLIAPEPTELVVNEDEPKKKKGPEYLYGYRPDDNFNYEQEYYNKYFGDMLIKQQRPKPPAPTPAVTDSTALIGEIPPVSTDSLANPINDNPPPDDNQEEKDEGGN